MSNPFILIGALYGFLAVALGAFGAHALKEMLEPAQLQTFQTGVLYQIFHAVVILSLGLFLHLHSGGGNGGGVGVGTASELLLANEKALKLVTISGYCFTAGILVFSGSLYTLSISGIRILGAITPIGGVLFLVGWLTLAYASTRLVK